MKHHDKNRKFGRPRNQRRALLRSLAVSLIGNEKIKTTEAKAKELRPFIERLITKGRTGTLAATRLVAERLGGSHKNEVRKLIDDISPRFKKREGGYTRITKTGRRDSDGSKMAVIEILEK